MANMLVKRLTLKQKSFCDYFLEMNNAYRAAIEAGYTPTSAQSMQTSLLKNPLCIEYLEKRRAEIAEARRQADLEKARERLSIDEKLDVLRKGIEHYVNNNQYLHAAKLIELDCRIQGHLAPEKHLNLSASLDAALARVRQVASQMLEEK